MTGGWSERPWDHPRDPRRRYGRSVAPCHYQNELPNGTATHNSPGRSRAARCGPARGRWSPGPRAPAHGLGSGGPPGQVGGHGAQGRWFVFLPRSRPKSTATGHLVRTVETGVLRATRHVRAPGPRPRPLVERLGCRGPESAQRWPRNGSFGSWQPPGLGAFGAIGEPIGASTGVRMPVLYT